MKQALLGALLGASMLAGTAAARPAPAAKPVAAKPTGAARARADSIVRQMTTEEKIRLALELLADAATVRQSDWLRQIVHPTLENSLRHSQHLAKIVDG